MTRRSPGVTLPVREMSKREKSQSKRFNSSRVGLIRRVPISAMTNSEDAAPQFSNYPYSWAPDCGVILDDFLKKVRARCFLTDLIIGAQWSAETLNGRR
jgi:hypothetical protein